VPHRPLVRLAALLSAAAIAAGCGGSATDHDEASLMLDFTPNAVHAGIYTALARDFDGAEAVEVDVRLPGESTDAVRLLEAGQVDFAILDISDLALARAKGSDIKAVMAVVQRPLAAVFTRPRITRPRALEGRRAGVTGLPSDVAVLDSVVAGDGGDPERVRRTTIGFTAVPALAGGRVDAVTAFWNVEGLALKRRLPGVREFRVERFGAPAYPELVLCASAETIQDDPGRVERLVAALRRGYEEVLRDPESAVSTMTSQVDGLDRARLLEQLRAVSPAFTAGVGRYGVLETERLRAWARWAARFGIVDEEPDVAAAFLPRFADAGG
jgi:ABC-type nitrate/sulfonate/bicarbonate transport system substrate-binding protein